MSVVDSQGHVAASSHVALGLQLLSVDASPLIEAFSPVAGSTEGGLTVCVRGQRLNASVTAPLVRIGNASCAVQRYNDSDLCCTTGGHVAGVYNVSVHYRCGANARALVPQSLPVERLRSYVYASMLTSY